MSLHNSSESYWSSKKGLSRDLSKMPEAITRWPLLVELQYWLSRLQRVRLPYIPSFRFLWNMRVLIFEIFGRFVLECHILKTTGCLEEKFTQEILNKIRSFWCTRLIFTRAHRKVGRSVWWRFHSNRLTLLALAKLWNNVLKIAYFCTPEDCYGKFITCLVSIANKIECTCFKFAISHELWSRRGGVTPHQTALMPRCSDRRQHFGHRLISRKLTLRLRCGVVASLARPISIGLFLRVMLRLKRSHVREPLTVIEFKIAIARESPSSPPISAAVQWTTTGTSDFCRFFTHFFKVPPKLVKWVDLAETFTRHFSQPWDKLKQKWAEYTQNCGFYSRFLG